jgi:hypothetical protein
MRMVHNLVGKQQIPLFPAMEKSYSGKKKGRYYRVLMMVYNTQRYWVFRLCPSSGFFLNNNEKTHFGNWICFRPQVREDTYSVGSLRKS